MPRCGQSGACQRFRAVNRRFDRLLLAPGAILSLPKPVKGRSSSAEPPGIWRILILNESTMFFSTSFVKNLVRSAFNVVGFEITRRPNTITLPFIKKLTLSDASLSDKFKMYHVGCGPLIADGFLNIDGNFKSYQSDKTTKIKSGKPYAVEGRPSTFLLQHDLRNGIPAATNSLEVIYHSHFFEHLTDHEGIAFLSECHRCLAPRRANALCSARF